MTDKNEEFKRPDLFLYEQEQDIYLEFDPFNGEYEPCPCCGAENPKNPFYGFICPVCSWEYDDETCKNPNMPSKQNHGLSLYEAKLNFGAFGSAYPPIFWDK